MSTPEGAGSVAAEAAPRTPKNKRTAEKAPPAGTLRRRGPGFYYLSLLLVVAGLMALGAVAALLVRALLEKEPPAPVVRLPPELNQQVKALTNEREQLEAQRKQM